MNAAAFLCYFSLFFLFVFFYFIFLCICLTFPFCFVLFFFSIFQIRVVNAFRMALDTRYDGRSLSSNYSSQSLENLRMRYKFPASPRTDGSASTNQTVDTSIWACTAPIWTNTLHPIFGSIQLGNARAAVGNTQWLNVTFWPFVIYFIILTHFYTILKFLYYSFRTYVLRLLIFCWNCAVLKYLLPSFSNLVQAHAEEKKKIFFFFFFF